MARKKQNAQAAVQPQEIQVVTSEPSAEEIAILAYHIYEQEGCPSGRDREHWHQAEMMLKADFAAKGHPPASTQSADS